jgi:N-acetylglucosamine-6-phosphate deacetylase
MNMTDYTEQTLNHLVEKSIDFHCHGIGQFDFTEILKIDLQKIESLLAERRQQSILTLYLPKPNFDDFLDLLESFGKQKKAGLLPHIKGFGLEGPLLASHGGTPEQGVWVPTQQHWKDLAACGKNGLIYVVLSPDARLEKEGYLNIPWITETLLSGGVLPAPGHFSRKDPKESARTLQTVFDVVEYWGQGPTMTDHLFNDMPHNFKHAWRTSRERMRRDEEIKALHIEAWHLDLLDEQLGLVPATMIKNARRGLVKLCQNFDGEHVDLAIAKKAVELAGAENMLMMTDSIESKLLAGRVLSMQENSTLLYQHDGIVAAGSQNVIRQIKNMFSMGLTLREIELLSHEVPSKLLAQHTHYFIKKANVEIACI